MGADDVYAIVLKERPTPDDDFMWRCPCGQSGRGSRSQVAHARRGAKHPLERMQTYVPAQRLAAVAEDLVQERGLVEKLGSMLPPEGSRVLADEQLREIIHAAIDCTFVEDWEDYAPPEGANDTHAQTIFHAQRLVWNEVWWDGFQTRLTQAIERASR